MRCCGSSTQLLCGILLTVAFQTLRGVHSFTVHLRPLHAGNSCSATTRRIHATVSSKTRERSVLCARSPSTTAVGDELTKEELNLRLYEVRDYYRQKPEEGVSQADICLSLLRTRLSNLALNRCFVAPSTIPEAGKGLFASRSIASGELITLYPGDTVLIQDTSGTAEETERAPVGVMFGSDAQHRIKEIVTSHKARSYEMEINARCSIVADPEIGSTDAAYLGHFANDGASLEKFDAVSREAYSKATAARGNAAHCAMEGAHLTTVATRDIEKGDEVFVTYGTGYWRSRSMTEIKTGTVVEIDPPIAKLEGTATQISGSPSRKARRSKKTRKRKENGPKKGFG